MKVKLVLVSFFAGLLIFGGITIFNAPPVGAQQTQSPPRLEEGWNPANVSDLYYVNVPIEKVYTYRKGYVVQFRRGINALGTAYIPFEWFGRDMRKAEVLYLRPGAMWPCMSVFFKDGAFHGVRLYVSKNKTHITWGNLPMYVNLDSNFEGVEAIDLGYPTK